MWLSQDVVQKGGLSRTQKPSDDLGRMRGCKRTSKICMIACDPCKSLACTLTLSVTGLWRELKIKLDDSAYSTHPRADMLIH